MEEMNNNSSGSDTDGEMDEDGDGTYDFAPLPPFDFQRESEEIRRTGALHSLRMSFAGRYRFFRCKYHQRCENKRRDT